MERYQEHCKKQYENHYRAHWLNKLHSLQLKPSLDVLEECDEFNWAEREIWWIAYGHEQGWPLTNGTAGGEGTFGYKFTDEVRKKMSERKIGTKRSEETTRKIALARTGIPRKASTIEKMRQKAQGRGSKLSVEKVLLIIEMLDNNKSQTEIAHLFDVDCSVISNIKRGKRWGWLTKRG